MAKSIYDILNDLQTETSVPKYQEAPVAHSIPRDLLPTAEQFEDESMLLEWANEQGITHAVMQKGIQKFLIEVRATFKACKKSDTWSEEYGQSNVNEMEWAITKRPNSKKSNEDTALDFMANLSPEQLQEFLAKVNQ